MEASSKTSNAEHVSAHCLSHSIVSSLKGQDQDQDFDIDQEFNRFFDWDSFCQGSDSLHQEHHHHEHQEEGDHQEDQLPSPDQPDHIIQVLEDITSFLGQYSVQSSEDHFHQMDTSFNDRHDIESASDHTYTYTNDASPPGLDPTRSTSPSDHSDGLLPELLDNELLDPVALRKAREGDDKWTYPLKDGPKNTSIANYNSPLPGQSPDAPASPILKRPHDETYSGKRQRHLVDPSQTADVRKSGACIPCRVAKIRCRDEEACPRCLKVFPEHSHLTCVRVTPAMTWPNFGRVPDLWSVNAAKEEALYSAPHFYIFSPRDISIFFDKDIQSAPLRVTVQEYRQERSCSPTTVSAHRYAGFPAEHVPSHALLKSWVEDQIIREHQPVFEQSVQSFLLAYAAGDSSLPKQSLVRRVHRMNCFFKIWKASSFYCLDPSNQRTTLPLSVTAQLRQIAKRGLDSLEHDVLKELDDALTQQGPLEPAETLSFWASMWQLLLMYRELIITFDQHLKLKKDTSPAFVKKQKSYHTLRDVVYPLMSIFHHFQFRTNKVLEALVECLNMDAIRNNPMLYRAGVDLINSRKTFYAKTQASDQCMDKLLSALVVTPEAQKVNNPRRQPKEGAKTKTPRAKPKDYKAKDLKAKDPKAKDSKAKESKTKDAKAKEAKAKTKDAGSKESKSKNPKRK